MSKQPDAMALADAYAHASFYQGLHQLTVYEEPEIARAKLDAELRRLHSLNAELVDALSGMYEAYCRAGPQLTKKERHEDRLRMMAALQAIAKAKEAQQ